MEGVRFIRTEVFSNFQCRLYISYHGRYETFYIKIFIATFTYIRSTELHSYAPKSLFLIVNMSKQMTLKTKYYSLKE